MTAWRTRREGDVETVASPTPSELTWRWLMLWVAWLFRPRPDSDMLRCTDSVVTRCTQAKLAKDVNQVRRGKGVAQLRKRHERLTSAVRDAAVTVRPQGAILVPSSPVPLDDGPDAAVPLFALQVAMMLVVIKTKYPGG